MISVQSVWGRVSSQCGSVTEGEVCSVYTAVLLNTEGNLVKIKL